jgi:hypothetical protein
VLFARYGCCIACPSALQQQHPPPVAFECVTQNTMMLKTPYMCCTASCLQPDASAWRGNPQAAERSMRVLTVPGRATTIINGALPSGFEDSHQPRFWVLEFIIKVRRCAWRAKAVPQDLFVVCLGSLCFEPLSSSWVKAILLVALVVRSICMQVALGWSAVCSFGRNPTLWNVKTATSRASGCWSSSLRCGAISCCQRNRTAVIV